MFTELTVPKFDGDLGVGGLSLGAPTAAISGNADRLRGALPLIPFATSELLPDANGGPAPHPRLVEELGESADHRVVSRR